MLFGDRHILSINQISRRGVNDTKLTPRTLSLHNMNRRQFLGGVGGFLVPLAGCVGGTDESNSTPKPDSPTGETPRTPRSTTTDGPTPTPITEPPSCSDTAATNQPGDTSVGTASSETAGDSQWWTYAHDLQNTGATLATGPTQPLDTKWTVTGAKAIFTTPAIVDGMVYFGASNNHLYAVDAKTGDVQWTYEANDYIVSSPTVIDDTVYFGTGDTMVFALSTEDGSERWRTSTNSRITPALAIADDMVVAGGYAGPFVYGIDRASGEIKWQNEADGWITNAPAVVDGTAYIASQRGTVYAFDIQTGDVHWSVTKPPREASHLTAPAVVDGTVYIQMRAFGPTTASKVYALSGETGEEVWATRTEGPNLPDTLAVNDGTVYVVSEQGRSCGSGCIQPITTLSALSANSGEIQWQGKWERSARTGPTVASDTVYFVAGERLMAVDPEGGCVRWERDLSGFAQRPPAIANGTLYLGDSSGTLWAIE